MMAVIALFPSPAETHACVQGLCRLFLKPRAQTGRRAAGVPAVRVPAAHSIHRQPSAVNRSRHAEGVPLASYTFTHRCLRCGVMWLLALVLPLQGTAMAVFNVMGPAHVHAASASVHRSMVLNDFRRAAPMPASRAAAGVVSPGHSHKLLPQRHRHALADRTVVRSSEDGAIRSLEADEAMSLSASLVSVLALVPAIVLWRPPQAQGALVLHRRWVPTTGFSQPLERPPRLG